MKISYFLRTSILRVTPLQVKYAVPHSTSGRAAPELRCMTKKGFGMHTMHTKSVSSAAGARPSWSARYTSFSSSLLQARPSVHFVNNAAPRLKAWASSWPSTETPSQGVRFCVVGSGPGGMYTAAQILQQLGPQVHVDVIDRLPTPFGLVRSGVAPDHAATKAVTNKFNQVLQDERCSFLGNVHVGRDVSLHELRQLYSGVVLAYGTETDRGMGIPGEHLRGSISAREFVWWYNGHPDVRTIDADLRHPTAVVVGLGNVAVDCARILLQSPAPGGALAATDIAQGALQALQQSTIRRVLLLGRRGPAQAAFTPKELRELLTLPGVKVCLQDCDFELSEYDQAHLKANRINRRVVETLTKAKDNTGADGSQGTPEKELHIRFFSAPVEVVAEADASGEGACVGGIRIEHTKVVDGRAEGTGETEVLECGLVLRSIGYRAVPLEGAPFDPCSGTIPNVNGRVVDPCSPDPARGDPQVGLYVAGWLKRGPQGIIGTNLNCAQVTVASIKEDLTAKILPPPAATSPGRDGLVALLRARSVQVVGEEGWVSINERELGRGEQVGKDREKFVTVPEMLEAATG